MKWLILVGLLGSVYCSENINQDVLEIPETLVADESNYGGYLPFLENRKFERGNYREAKDYGRVVLKNDDQKYIDPLREEKKDDGRYRVNRGYCIGEYRYKDGYDNDYRNGDDINNRYDRFYSNNIDDGVKERCDKLFGYTGPTANDEPENLIRPCALDDWQCIRKYFAANSDCKPAYGPIPDPLFIGVNTAFFTLANLTVALTNMTVRGLSSAKVEEFYVNKKTGNLVLALDVRNVNLSIPRAYFRYRRTAKEPIVLADFATVNFRAVTLTAVIPNIPKLRLDLADIHADIRDSSPHIIGPGAANSTDPDVITALAEFNLFLPISIIEGAFFQGQLFTAIYIQANICDFGLKLVSV